MLIHAPQLDVGVWMLVLHHGKMVRQFFNLVLDGFIGFGRGTRLLCPRRNR
jgi:hypothetical protein